jgi:hypothetical protein
MSCKLSVIVTGRNDNYDGDFDERLCIALSQNIKSLPDAEFIFVEWNSYTDRPLVCSRLKKIFSTRVKYYAVDPKYHDKYCTIDGFLEYPPKNVGIRRASGDFIISTNSDVVFCPDLVDNLKKADLDKKAIYRASRIDIPITCRYVTFPLSPELVLEEFSGPTNACGDFLMLSRDVWHKSTGYCEEFPAQRLHKDSEMVCRLVDQGRDIVYVGAVTHWRHKSSWVNGFTQICGDVNWDYRKTGFTKNVDTWGLTYTREIERDGITWLV